MYTITEVELTDPALVEMFGRLSASLGHSKEEEASKLHFTQAGLQLAVVAWHDGKAVGCGLLRQEDQGVAELKRVYSDQAGVGSAILQYLQHVAQQRGYQKLLAAVRLTNSKAINFFFAKGFKKCASYGKYRYSSQMLCLEKALKAS